MINFFWIFPFLCIVPKRYSQQSHSECDDIVSYRRTVFVFVFVLFSIEPIKNVNETVNGSHRQMRASLCVLLVHVLYSAHFNCSCIYISM